MRVASIRAPGVIQIAPSLGRHLSMSSSPSAGLPLFELMAAWNTRRTAAVSSPHGSASRR